MTKTIVHLSPDICTISVLLHVMMILLWLIVLKLWMDMSPVMRKPAFCIYENKEADQLRKQRSRSASKTKKQISFEVTAKLISAFVLAIRIVQSLFYLNTKFQASSHLLWLYSRVCVGPGRKPRRPVFSQRSSYVDVVTTSTYKCSCQVVPHYF